MRPLRTGRWLAAALLLALGWSAASADQPEEPSAVAAARLLDDAERQSARSAIFDWISARIRQGNQRSSQEWYKIDSRDAWEAYRDQRLARLRQSLGSLPRDAAPPQVHVSGTIQGDGYVVENIAFDSQGLWVTANLYRPDPPRDSMPGILICHSHHAPKTQGELQDMGVIWARVGCVVLVMDQVGHGERRQHPFAAADDWPESFRVSRQDYYFRYDTGIQLHLVGESLIGWMARDLMRGADVLLAQRGIDPKRIILLGGVAGGGDPAGVTAALDARIACVVPFNFGGPQPETRYPLPDDAEQSFNYGGSGSWESTRNLRRSYEDGFLPWLIVGSVAPRHLIHAHEFAWDQKRDPVWKRYQKIFGDFYGAADRLAVAHGFGQLRQSPPEASHCGNIGQEHRKMIHPRFQQWFGIRQPEEVSQRRDSAQLRAMNDQLAQKLRPQWLHQRLQELAVQRVAKAHDRLKDLSGDQRRAQLAAAWSALLGGVEPTVFRNVEEVPLQGADESGPRLERFLLHTGAGIPVPLMLIVPRRPSGTVVVVLSQAEKSAWLAARRQEVEPLVEAGHAVCLVDPRGMGQTSVGDYRGRQSSATSASSSLLMLADTMLGAQLRDLRGVLRWLRQRGELRSTPDAAPRFVLWGDSLAEPNAEEPAAWRTPRGIDAEPRIGEPGGALLAMLAGLYEDDLRGIFARGGLPSFATVLESQFVHLPHDVVLPGAVPAGDLPAVAAAAGCPVAVSRLIDGRNCLVPEQKAGEIFRAAQGEKPNLQVVPGPTAVADWLR